MHKWSIKKRFHGFAWAKKKTNINTRPLERTRNKKKTGVRRKNAFWRFTVVHSVLPFATLAALDPQIRAGQRLFFCDPATVLHLVANFNPYQRVASMTSFFCIRVGENLSNTHERQEPDIMRSPSYSWRENFRGGAPKDTHIASGDLAPIISQSASRPVTIDNTFTVLRRLKDLSSLCSCESWTRVLNEMLNRHDINAPNMRSAVYAERE